MPTTNKTQTPRRHLAKKARCAEFPRAKRILPMIVSDASWAWKASQSSSSAQLNVTRRHAKKTSPLRLTLRTEQSPFCTITSSYGVRHGLRAISPSSLRLISSILTLTTTCCWCCSCCCSQSAGEDMWWTNTPATAPVCVSWERGWFPTDWSTTRSNCENLFQICSLAGFRSTSHSLAHPISR